MKWVKHFHSNSLIHGHLWPIIFTLLFDRLIRDFVLRKEGREKTRMIKVAKSSQQVTMAQ